MRNPPPEARTPVRAPSSSPTGVSPGDTPRQRTDGDTGGRPGRRLIKRTGPRTVHLLNLRALAAPVQAEATTEADFVRLAALCPSVRHIVAQPPTVQLASGKYTPDYRVECHNGTVSYWEIKLESRFKKYRTLFDEASTHFHSQGLRFYVVSNVSLRRDEQHELAELLHRYGKARPCEADIERALSALSEAPFGYSLERLAAKARVSPELIYHLIACRRITFKNRIRVSDLLVLPETLEKTDDFLLASWLDVSPWRTNAGASARTPGWEAGT
jgi:hypothetical protein